MKKVIIGITGASGSIYGLRIIEELIKAKVEVHIVTTNHGKKVFEYELQKNYEEFIKGIKNNFKLIFDYEEQDMFARIASGSNIYDAMIIIPCSMGTLAKIANGISDNLLIRSADVSIKEKRQLIIVPRETPLNQIHLENMLKLSKMGIEIIPPMPQLYSMPSSIEELIDVTIGRILSRIGIENKLIYKWNYNNTLNIKGDKK